VILRIPTGVLRRLINNVVNQTSTLFLAIDMALFGIECLPLRLLSDAVLPARMLLLNYRFQILGQSYYPLTWVWRGD